jgi:uracil-DNA glycosylase
MNPEEVQIESSWRELLKEEFSKSYFSEIRNILYQEKKAGKVIFPPGKLIFNAFNLCPVDKLKVVILGQDPYHNIGEAMGLCFSVPQGIKIPPSLQNIYRELQTDLGCKIPTHGDLTKWAEQGVLLLNTSLTVEKNKPMSHSKIGWHIFTDAVISNINAHTDKIVFMLWGNFAKSKASIIEEQKHFILQSAHPSPLAGGAFFGNKHFSKANSFLQLNGRKPIDWQID